MSSKTPIGPGTRVVLTFKLSLDGGQMIDSTGDKNVELVIGDGNLLPGFESLMFGLLSGESGEFQVPAESAFGPSNPNNLQMMKRTDFGADIELSAGLVVSFADQQNAELPGVVTRILGDLVEVDFNHPLAGRDVLFEVDIVEVEQISNEILRV